MVDNDTCVTNDDDSVRLSRGSTTVMLLVALSRPVGVGSTSDAGVAATVPAVLSTRQFEFSGKMSGLVPYGPFRSRVVKVDTPLAAATSSFWPTGVMSPGCERERER